MSVQAEAVAEAAAMEPVMVADPGAVACKVCGTDSPLVGVVDFHKSCIEQQGKRLAMSGRPIYYRRCTRCGFLFTTALDGWDFEAFRQNIYNDEYVLVDPDYVEARPAGNAAMIAGAFPDAKGSMTVLDYGGGAGLLAARLREQGFAATTWDPFSGFDAMPAERFDLITCFEVMEHVPFPQKTVAEMVGLMKRPGAILFSTLVQPAGFDQVGLSWWYAAPRNGHISIYSTAALALLFQPYGLKVGSFNEGLHIAYGEIPAFTRHLKLA
jgi:2-polyprenyl-6-hydroxyphenyl methylase/3-demethylubiquinone-9 3-methyltransferase